MAGMRARLSLIPALGIVAVTSLCACNDHRASPKGARRDGAEPSTSKPQAAAEGVEPSPPARVVPPPSAPDEAEPTGAAEVGELPPPTRPERINFSLRDADAGELVTALGAVTNKPVNVGRDAEPVLACASVTVHKPEPVTPSEAVRLVAAALRPQGIIVTETGAAIDMRRAPDARPCPRR